MSDEVSVSKARQEFAAVVERARSSRRPVYVARRGRRIAAVVDADELDRVTALAEDMEDILAAEAARDEMRATAREPVPWDEVRSELGLT